MKNLLATYRVREGKFHKGGTVHAEVIHQDGNFAVKVSYHIQKKGFIPVPGHFLKGEYILDLPPEFSSEAGYKALEAQKTMVFHRARINFLGRVDTQNRKNAYRVQILPHNGKSKIEIIYHPDIHSIGWPMVEIILTADLPLLNGYEIVADLAEEAPESASIREIT